MSLLEIDLTNRESQEAKLEEVIKLFNPTDGISPQDLSGTGFTYRHDWGDRRGTWNLHLNWNVINRNSRVFVAIGEGAPGGGKFIGEATFALYNVAPNDGVVSIRVNIGWNEPIRLYVDYLIVNP